MLVRATAGLRAAFNAQKPRMSTEPGLDLHEWESEYRSIEPDLEDSPREALPELLDLVGRMLVSRGYAIDDPVADDGHDPEILAEFRAVRESTRAIERGDEGVGPGDVAVSVNGLRAIYEHLVAEHPAP
jgi:hypothetical protein